MKTTILLVGLTLMGCTEIRQNSVCREVCDRSATCSSQTDEQDCRDSCETEVERCNANTQDEALDRLDECGDETCDNLGACVVDAYLTCNFGEDQDR